MVKCTKVTKKCGNCYHAKKHEHTTSDVCCGTTCMRFAEKTPKLNADKNIMRDEFGIIYVLVGQIPQAECKEI